MLLAGFALAATSATSIGAVLGLPAMAWVDGPAGAWASLLPLAALVFMLVRVPLQHALRRSA